MIFSFLLTAQTSEKVPCAYFRQTWVEIGRVTGVIVCRSNLRKINRKIKKNDKRSKNQTSLIIVKMKIEDMCPRV